MTPARWFVLVGLSLGLLGLAVGLSRELSLSAHAASLLVSTASDAPPTPLQLRDPPSVREVVYQTSTGRSAAADLYHPGRGSRGPAVIVMPGVMRNVRAYPPLVRLADSFARAGYVVLVPEGLDYAHYRVLPDDIDALVAGFKWLARHESVDPARIGFVGLSVGGSLALVAAADSRIAGDVALVAAVGAYADLDVVLQAVTTGYARSNGVLNPFAADPLAWVVVRNTLVGNLPSTQDRALLFELFPGATPALDGAALTRLDTGLLTPAGRAVFDLFLNRDPGAAPDLVSRLRARLPDTLETISPSAHADSLRAPVMLLHDRGDSYVPAGESERLARRLSGQVPVRLTILDVLQHVEISAPELSADALLASYIPGMWGLFTFTYEVLDGL